MRLSKHHGLRNDFLVVLDEVNGRAVEVGPDTARLLCDRRAGLGADGLIHGARTESHDTDVTMHLWNADGSRAEMSGNGIRCLAQAVAVARGGRAGQVVAETDAGRRHLDVTLTTEPDAVAVRVDMGLVGEGPDHSGLTLPFATKEIGTADLGNPHLVAWVDSHDALDAVDLASAGPDAERHFPHGVNLEVITSGPDPDSLALRVWERGVGITQACGTGACAAAALAARWGLVRDVVRVDMPGGSVVVELVDGRAVLTGPAVHVADIEVPDRG
ncbi:MAG: diaminopimelate epimerase [Acidimicrobiales bacterium]